MVQTIQAVQTEVADVVQIVDAGQAVEAQIVVQAIIQVVVQIVVHVVAHIVVQIIAGCHFGASEVVAQIRQVQAEIGQAVEIVAGKRITKAGHIK